MSRVRTHLFGALAAGLVLVCGVAAPAISPQPAAAGTFTVVPCLDSADRWYRGSSGPSSGWTFNYGCPDGPIEIGGQSPLTGMATWAFPPSFDTRRQMTELRVRVEGSTGEGDVSYRLVLCGNGLICDGPALPMVPGPEYDPTPKIDLAEGDPGFFTGADYVRAEAICNRPVGTECEPAPPMQLSGIVMKFRDDHQPIIDRSLNSSGTDLQNAQWINGPKKLTLKVSDTGSGVYYYQFTSYQFANEVTSRNWQQVVTECGTTSSGASTFKTLCPLSHTLVVTVDPADVRWKQGHNLMMLRAYDQGRNASELFEMVFYIDTHAPPPPPDLTVAGVGPFDGTNWSTSRTGRIEWTNVNNGMSPLTEAIVDIDPLDQGASDPGPVYLVVDPRNTSLLPSSYDLTWPSPGRWRVSVRTRDQAGNLGEPSTVEVGVDPTVPDAVTPSVANWLNAAGLAQTDAARWPAPANTELMPSGVCGYRMAVDGETESSGEGETALAGEVTAAPLPAGLAEGRWYVHLRAVSCAGLAGPATSVPFDVDRTPPAIEGNVAGGTWLGPADQFSLHAVDAGGSGVSHIQFSDNGSAALTASDWVAPSLDEGRHAIEYRSFDHAGNHSETGTVEFGVDRSAPTGWIESQDPLRPTYVSARVTDRHSGVDDAVLEYRPADGSGAWQPLVSPTDPVRVDSDTIAVAARFPDTAVADGAYAIRVVARDRVGNRAALGELPGGGDATILTPARGKARISFGARLTVRCARRAKDASGAKAARRTCKQNKPARRLVTPGGSKVVVTGRMIDGRGKPVAGERLELVQKNQFFKSARVIGGAVTSEDGRFSTKIPAGMNRDVTARFSGSETLAPAEAMVTLSTPARLSFSVNDRTARPGQMLTFSGQIRLGEAKLTSLGLKVEIKYWAGGEWNSLAEGDAMLDGSYTIRKRALRVRRPLKIRLYAFVDQVPGWPYIDGWSKPVNLVIRP